MRSSTYTSPPISLFAGDARVVARALPLDEGQPVLHMHIIDGVAVLSAHLDLTVAQLLVDQLQGALAAARLIADEEMRWLHEIDAELYDCEGRIVPLVREMLDRQRLAGREVPPLSAVADTVRRYLSLRDAVVAS